MKKCLFTVGVMVFLLGCLCLTATAMTPVSGDVGREASAVMKQLADAVGGIIPRMVSLASRLGGFSYVVYFVVTVVMLGLACVGYRFHTAHRCILGVFAGMFLGYLGWRLIMSLAWTPAFFSRHDRFFLVFFMILFPVLGAAAAFHLRRVAGAVSVGLIVASLLTPLIGRFYILLVFFVAVTAVAFFANRAAIILLTSLACPTFVIYLWLGPTGVFPIHFSGFFVGVVEPALLIGLALGMICAVIHFRLARKIRA